MDIQWPLCLFTCLACTALGTSMTAALTAVICDRKITKEFLVAAILAVAGIVISFFHLTHPLNAVNVLGNLSKNIGLEMLLLVLAIVCLGVLSTLVNKARSTVAIKAMAIVTILVSACSAVMLGISYVIPAIPAWNTYLLPVEFLAGAILAGSLVAKLIEFGSLPEKAELSVDVLVYAGGILSLVVGALYALFGSDIAVLDGITAGLLWGGVVLVGSIISLVFLAATKKMGLSGIICALACAEIGLLCFRMAYFLMGSHIPYIL